MFHCPTNSKVKKEKEDTSALPMQQPGVTTEFSTMVIQMVYILFRSEVLFRGSEAIFKKFLSQ